MLFAQTPCWLVALPGSGLYRTDSVFPRTFQRPGQAARIAAAMGGRVLAWDEVYPTARAVHVYRLAMPRPVFRSRN
jgi:nitrous oxide reductase accessory protein NosL